MNGRLNDRVAIITGGASGMGAATVRKFVAEGAKVLIVDLQEDKGEALAAELGEAARFLAVDVAIEAEVKHMVDTAVNDLGGLHILFNNAGFGGVSGAIHETDMGDAYRRTVDAMFTGPILGIKHATPVMTAQKSGSIITTASVAGLQGGLGPHVYSGIKAAVIGLTRSVSLELGPHYVRANAICPGGIATPIFAGNAALGKGSNQDWAAAVRPALQHMQPIPRAGEGDDIANAACFLASDESSFITGQALVVDGGLTSNNYTPPHLADNLGTIADALGVDYETLDSVVPEQRHL